MKPDLVLLTNYFPSTVGRSEEWLYEELKITHDYYNIIYILPDKFNEELNALPENTQVVLLSENEYPALNLSELINCIRIVISDFKSYPSKKTFFRDFRYNVALIKHLHRKAKAIAYHQSKFGRNTIIYAYWADNLATTASILCQRYMESKIVARGHGFEIFEDQTKNGMIPFRRFQYRYLSKLFADSKRGQQHLNKKWSGNFYHSINDCSYVGTDDQGLGIFNPENRFTIVTCSYIRNVKRLHLLPEILKHVGFGLEWHVLGDGPDLPALKKANDNLPSNIHITYHGYLKNEEILSFYKTHSVNLFVSLSSSEGLPVSMMEAASFGIPILSTDVGGCSEICNENTGLLIEKDFDPGKAAHVISEFARSQKNTLQFRQGVRKFWEQHFDSKTNYKRFAETITSL